MQIIVGALKFPNNLSAQFCLIGGTIHANPEESWCLANPIGDYLGTNAVAILIAPQSA